MASKISVNYLINESSTKLLILGRLNLKVSCRIPVFIMSPQQNHTIDTVLRKPEHLKDNLLSVRDTLDILGGKWKIPILLSLSCQKKRFNEIQKDLINITSKILSKELKELEMNHIITRIDCDESPYGVEYAVTIYCKSLEKIIEGLKEWGDHHRAIIFRRSLVE
jgi:DNA-binding HxlR family transcriptional regulator